MNLPQLKEDLRGISKQIEKLNIVRKTKNIVAATLFLAVMPFPTFQSVQKESDWVTNCKIDTNSQTVLAIIPKTVDIQVGESEYGKKIKAQREAQAREKQLTVLKAKKSEVVLKAHAQEPAPAEFVKIYQSAGAQYGVPWQVLEAVHQVETGKSGSTSKQSYAGATGPMQFLPSTWRHYGVDGNGDGSSDISDVTDAVYGAANYLAAGGASEGKIEQALFNYNHSNAYVNKVLGIAREIGYNQ